MTGQPRRRADALRNRDAIVSAARELVVARGPDIGMDDIAVAAGVAVGTIYRHFPTKTDLMEAIVTDLATEIAASLESATARVCDGESTALEEIIALLSRVVMDMRQERLLRYAVAGLAPDSLREVQRQARHTVARWVDAAHRDKALYRDITVEDVILLLATAPDDARPEAEHRRWLTLARRALAPESA
ncbi:TetR/AcrR family transcriptional regulator [Nocardia australiensis]|uniref:TetR/AcrR family transcriptional regulator n=1 Tax=Nocardia australiensis TaxID=2887191 RepID=UPI001D13A950|nr:TetR/AcrR family transcriptional regulator [Nocardia australiensis]